MTPYSTATGSARSIDRFCPEALLPLVRVAREGEPRGEVAANVALDVKQSGESACPMKVVSDAVDTLRQLPAIGSNHALPQAITQRSTGIGLRHDWHVQFRKIKAAAR